VRKTLVLLLGGFVWSLLGISLCVVFFIHKKLKQEFVVELFFPLENIPVY
jgi:hypothetical protein